jgi:hypothetical protein
MDGRHHGFSVGRARRGAPSDARRANATSARAALPGGEYSRCCARRTNVELHHPVRTATHDHAMTHVRTLFANPPRTAAHARAWARMAMLRKLGDAGIGSAVDTILQ